MREREIKEEEKSLSTQKQWYHCLNRFVIRPRRIVVLGQCVTGHYAGTDSRMRLIRSCTETPSASALKLAMMR